MVQKLLSSRLTSHLMKGQPRQLNRNISARAYDTQEEQLHQMLSWVQNGMWGGCVVLLMGVNRTKVIHFSFRECSTSDLHKANFESKTQYLLCFACFIINLTYIVNSLRFFRLVAPCSTWAYKKKLYINSQRTQLELYKSRGKCFPRLLMLLQEG